MDSKTVKYFTTIYPDNYGKEYVGVYKRTKKSFQEDTGSQGVPVQTVKTIGNPPCTQEKSKQNKEEETEKTK